MPVLPPSRPRVPTPLHPSHCPPTGAVPGRASSAALLVTSVTSVLASLYLALVLAFGLHDLCLVCLSTYVVNAALLFLNWRRWRRCGQTAVRKRE